ncbi:MAG: enoyl-CoA hydratase [Candidatus Hydrogenedentes bacterium]|jgi:enoyl-CoA hydratase/carnithine racemase|nr:enoyl-CoA hydratase [Candidatus Hydrogenedentota bacterium]
MSDTERTTEAILSSEENRVLYIVFNRYEKKNALNHSMYARLAALLDHATATPSIRAVCFCGSKDIFCGGNDIKDFLSATMQDENAPVLQFLRAVIDFPKPMVAAVEGAAIGIGTTLLLHCDLVYASKAAYFQTPFTGLALCPEAASSVLLPKVVGLTRASAMLLLGQKIDAATALSWGLLTEILPEESFNQSLTKRLNILTALPPEAVRATKALLRAPLREACQEGLQREIDLFTQRLSSPEAAEAVQAFLERRPPDFSHFE